MMRHADLAKAAKLAYPSTCSRNDTEAEMFRLFPGEPLRMQFIQVDRIDTEGFLARSGSRVIVVFAGTESWRDLLTDVWFLPGSYYLGNQKMVVHSGFADVINEVRLTLIRAFRELYSLDPDGVGEITQVIGAGHSLGAAVALGALDVLWYVFPEIQGKTRAVTFGCPNGWSGSAVKSFEARHPDVINYINPWDYVTWFLGLSSGRPGRCVKLSGRAGHFMNKYIENMEAFYDGKSYDCCSDPAVNPE